MSFLAPTNFETFDYGASGWSSIEISNWQKLNGFLNKFWILQTAAATENDKLIKYNSTTGVWEVSSFTATNVASAVANSHTHSNKALLDSYTQANTDLASAVALRHSQQHLITSTADHTSTATHGKLLKADANGLPVEAVNSDTLAIKTVNYTLTNTDSIILGDATAGVITFTLPTAVGIAGRLYTFVKVDSSVNTVTVAAAGTETINGAATKVLSTQWDKCQIVSNGSNWVIVA